MRNVGLKMHFVKNKKEKHALFLPVAPAGISYALCLLTAAAVSSYANHLEFRQNTI
jgi:hypothetical protein